MPRVSVPESTSPGCRTGQMVALSCQTLGSQHWEPGPGLGAGARGPAVGTHTHVCMPVALWLLMAAAFLPCSAKPWQTGKKKGSLSLQEAEIFHHELAHLCNKKEKTFKRAVPRNGLSQACGKSQPLLDCVGAGRPCRSQPWGLSGALGAWPPHSCSCADPAVEVGQHQVWGC